ncbi:MAG: hypothetical protein FWE03_00490 [Firmicutes bacterium]|nr:hypothetical protein [Bacillota bacterium]
MDLKDILPLLMKNSDPKMAGVFNAMGGGDSSKLFEEVLGKDEKNKNIMTMFNLMNQAKKNKSSAPQGLAPVYPFISTQILGTLVKYYGKY